MRCPTLLAAAFLMSVSATAHAAPPALGLSVLRLDGVVGDVAIPLVGTLVAGLPPIPVGSMLPLQGVVPTLVGTGVIPLASGLLGGGLPALPGLPVVGSVVPVAVTGVALPLLGGL
ncbi:MAG: hypothetical protein K0Q76_4189 [Panacagrimonas sp.]|jgi:hypothetical protein|nr:hypothetical protein [Panacagrimonas sp.]MCC2659081.1 hypothetical protein [Panacagrimonas sp.]